MSSDGPIVRLEIGRVTKVHGLKGEVLVLLSTNVEGRLAKGTVLDSDRGPLTIEKSRRHQDKWLVKFAGIDRREMAEDLGRPTLYGSPVVDDDALWIHELIGCEVTDTAGTHRGTVVEVQDNPAADLLVLTTGALVPLTFVASVSDEMITVDVPAGLFELYEE